MKSEYLHDVVVLGAGVAGGSMAYTLAAKGWDTVLLDRSPFPRHKVCGEFLSPESQRILRTLGLEQLVRSLGPVDMDAARLILPGGAALEIPLPGPAFGISRHALDHALHHAVQAKGGIVLTGVTVHAVTPTERGYRIEAQARRERMAWEARAVIGAWGRTPPPGLSAGLKPEAARSIRIGIKTHVEGMKPGRAVELYFFPGGYAGIAPVGAGLSNAAALIARETFRDAGRTVDGVLELAGRLNPAFGRRLAEGRLVPGSQAAVSPAETSRPLTPWGHVPHIGDAAALIPPLCGDGMAMALRSVERCAPLADDYLRGRRSLSDWRRAYTQALRRDFASPIRWGRLLQLGLSHAAAAPLLLRLGSLSPGLAYRLLQATRLKDAPSRY